MKTVILLSLYISVANGCGNNAYRCVNPAGSVLQDWEVTQSCMTKVGFSDTCWCYHYAENFADPTGDNIEAFKNCCLSYPNYNYREC